MAELLTPSKLAKKTNAENISVGSYDWTRQVRWDPMLVPVAGKYTGSSVQTFDSKGKPNDSRSDNND